mmetsp:Transcript_2066/g.4531  ORF Transcript_2066/g.4531 Transcript_2066/m.4531 type:complete len:104 (-) Transcript_2066:707-1018(-)
MNRNPKVSETVSFLCCFWDRLFAPTKPIHLMCFISRPHQTLTESDIFGRSCQALLSEHLVEALQKQRHDPEDILDSSHLLLPKARERSPKTSRATGRPRIHKV